MVHYVVVFVFTFTVEESQITPQTPQMTPPIQGGATVMSPRFPKRLVFDWLFLLLWYCTVLGTSTGYSTVVP